MRFLVLSDIYAFSVVPSDGMLPSYVKAGGGSHRPEVALREQLEKGIIPKPDLIVCPGDLCHQADQQGLAIHPSDCQS
jgi:hypothetical protein